MSSSQILQLCMYMTCVPGPSQELLTSCNVFVNFASDRPFFFFFSVFLLYFRSFCSCLIEPEAKSPELQELIEVNLEFQVQIIHLTMMGNVIFNHY